MKQVFLHKVQKESYIWKIFISIIAIIAMNIITLLSCILGSLIYRNVNITSFSEMLSDTMNSNFGYVLCIIITIGLTYLLYNFLIKKKKISWEEMGFTQKSSLSKILKGFILGVLFVLIYISILIFTKQVMFEFFPLNINTVYLLFMGLIIFFGVAFIEEITFRGYIQSILSKKYKYIGLLLSALLFALSHLLNSNYSLLSLVYLVMAGIMMGIMRMKTKSIWFPIGFHLAWNWTEIRIFGLGNNTNNHWLSTNIAENTIWNGGESGSGLVIIITEIILILFFSYLYYRKNSKVID